MKTGMAYGFHYILICMITTAWCSAAENLLHPEPRRFLKFGAKVTVISPALCAELR